MTEREEALKALSRMREILRDVDIKSVVEHVREGRRIS